MKLYNTLTKQKEEFVPVHEGKVGMYVCGPTVYNYIHIGNARPMIVFDTVRRYFEYKGYDVNYVSNFTDVDDKIIKKANEEGVPASEISERFIAECKKDMEGLNIEPATHNPKATEEIDGMIAMISTLIEKGYAYEKNGTVYFRTRKFKNYGQLSKKNLDDMRAGIRIAVSDEKEDAMDFVLWKPKKEGEPAWVSPWGEGRPGWHIECSAMSTKYLGPSFDLHGGGIDLCFPHHENEIAQSECSTGCKPYVKYWFHSAHLMVEGAKMSKSLGNLYTFDDLAAKGYTAQQIRYALISGHYRQQLNFTFKGLDDAKSALAKLSKSLKSALEKLGLKMSDFKKLVKPSANFEGTAFEGAWAALCDDINVPKAIGEIFASLGKLGDSQENLSAFGGLMYALGIDLSEIEAETQETPVEIPDEIVELANKRWEAKKAKNFALADELRKKISDLGWTVLDKKDGFDIKK